MEIPSLTNDNRSYGKDRATNNKPNPRRNLGIKACSRKSETGLVAFQSEESPANWHATREATTMVKAR